MAYGCVAYMDVESQGNGDVMFIGYMDDLKAWFTQKRP